MTSPLAHRSPAPAATPRRQPIRRRATNRPLQILLALCAFAVFATLPSIAEAANHRWCVRYKIDSDDRAYGDYGTAQYWMGRGVRVLVWTGNSTPYEFFNAEESTGCFNFSSPWATGMTAWVIHETKIANQGGTMTLTLIRANSTPYTEFSNITTTYDPNTQKWGATLTLDSGDAHHEEALGIITYGFHSLLSAATYSNAMPSQFRIERGYSGTMNNAYARPDKIVAGSPFREEKFLLAHEVGHAASFNLGGGLDATDIEYSYYFGEDDPSSLSTTCRWNEVSGEDVGGHAMRSQEFSSGAFNEGFAHFISAIIWNSTASQAGQFKYYKSHLIYGYAKEVYPLDQPGSWSHDWLFTSSGCDCDAPSRANCEGSNVEVSWLRALWTWRTAPGTKPTLPQVFSLYFKIMSGSCYPHNNENTSSVFSSALGVVSSSLLLRWNSIAVGYYTNTAPAGSVTCL